MRRSPWLWAAVWLLPLWAACDSTMNKSLEGKACSPDDTCLPGWVCSEDKLCVRTLTLQNQNGGSGGARAAGSGGARAAGSGGRGGSPSAGRAGSSAPGECSAAQRTCGDKCVDLTSDPAHCGACDKVCTAAEGGSARCTASKCTSQCPDGQLECSGKCVAQNTTEHCGSCAACAAGQTCAAGQCTLACAPPRVICDGVCVDPLTDVSHCGACTSACSAQAGGATVCQAGACVSTCNAGLTACSGGCMDLASNAEHCGACGHACPTVTNGMAACAAGECTMACIKGFTRCTDRCVSDTVSQQASLIGLGALGACEAFAALTTLNEVLVCRSNEMLCGALCIDVLSDAENCSACGAKCIAAETCNQGRCVIAP